jgi:hypothetical protein
MATQGQTLSSWLTQTGIIIALITGNAYFWALRYEAGWYEHFQLPHQLISLDVVNVLSIAGTINLLFAFISLQSF